MLPASKKSSPFPCRIQEELLRRAMEVVNMFIRLLSNTHQFGWHVNKSTRSVRMIRGEIPLGT